MLNRTSPEWQTIISNSNKWFDPQTLRFWGSTILWGTLSSVSATESVFVSKEYNFDRSEKLYSLRRVQNNEVTDTIYFQTTADLLEAKRQLRAYVALNKPNHE